MTLIELTLFGTRSTVFVVFEKIAFMYVDDDYTIKDKPTVVAIDGCPTLRVAQSPEEIIRLAAKYRD